MGFAGDDRGVSAIIGFLFAFSILIGLAIAYQVSVVPAQNEATEFRHFENNKDDLQEMRDALINAGADGEAHSATIELGQTYRGRAIFLNAAPASGTIETQGSIGDGEYQKVGTSSLNFTRVCGIDTGTDDDVPVHHIEYRPSYNYLSVDAAQIYENTLYYQQLTNPGSTVLNRTDQHLVQPNGSGGGTIAIYPLQDSFDESGVSSDTVTFVGGETREVRVTDPEIEIPTRLSESQWKTLGVDPNDISGLSDIKSATGSDNELEFEFTNTWTVKCTPIGISSAPEQVDTSVVTVTSATAVDRDTDGSTGDKEALEVTLQNNGASPKKAEAISIDKVETVTVDDISNETGDPEAKFKTTGEVNIPTNEDINVSGAAVGFETVAVIPENGDATAIVGDFTDSGTDVDLEGAKVTFTIYFGDGTSQTYTVSV